MHVLVTGHAGFIGFHVARALLMRGDSVVGIDNLNDYYEVSLKQDRLRELEQLAVQLGASYRSVTGDISQPQDLAGCFDGGPAFDRVIHLAAQAGVGQSLTQPLRYAQSNLMGFTVVLEACRAHQVPHLTYASSSSVYGANTQLPFREQQAADHPIQLYAATKRANELMAHSYSHLFQLPTTGLRFFTVYGPWGRPDMALFKFTRSILRGEPIKVFNHGRQSRDFTFIDDIVDGVLRVSDQIAAGNPDWDGRQPDACSSAAPWRVFNLGHGAPVPLLDYIRALERALGREAQLDLQPAQPFDVPDTAADVTAVRQAVGWQSSTAVNEGVQRFVDWFRGYYR